MLSLGLLVGSACHPLHAEEPEPPRPQGDAVVVVELFTSQGCSSCPSADEALAELGRDPKLAGRVLPLAYHVDYWNYIGWADPFSSEAWSEHQRRYAEAMGEKRLYTPQAVVQGAKHMVGSHRAGLREAVEEASRAPVSASLTVGARRSDVAPGELTATVSVKVEQPIKATGPLVVTLVVFERGRRTHVERGENAGKALANDFIVRSRVGALNVDPAAGSTGEKLVVVPLDPAWSQGRLGVAAILRDPRTMKIHAAASVAIPQGAATP